MTSAFVPAAAVPRRRLFVRHLTRYRYEQAVPKSSHRLHLRPIYDWKQSVLSHNTTIRADGRELDGLIEYENAFGNPAARIDVDGPYTELQIVGESLVEVLDVDPFAFASVPIRPQFPMNWTPRDATVLAPYLTSVELPDTQLEELYQYALSFVRVNHGDLMETLFNLNLELYRNYKYVPGSTSNNTTPFEVYSTKQGVCQDFAQLFICMARLLGLPARYVCGYIFTGNTGIERAQSDASHAWVQLYIPNVGWKGFDPTNGVMPQIDHVRVAVGRHFRDTAPIDGTLYGGVGETMEIDVEVRDAGTADVGEPTPPAEEILHAVAVTPTPVPA